MAGCSYRQSEREPKRRSKGRPIDHGLFENLMRRDFTLRKRTILGGVILLVLADVALDAYSWQLSSAPRAPRAQLGIEPTQHNICKADIKRAQDLREHIPAIQKDRSEFE